MKRGDLVTVALQGDLGKPRPALLIQSDLFSDHPSVAVLPVTSNLQAAPLFRIGIEPDASNGLRQPSQVMVDKMQAVPRLRVGPVFGRVDDATMLAVNRALAVFLALA
jgi:mRNA interferase MazF